MVPPQQQGKETLFFCVQVSFVGVQLLTVVHLLLCRFCQPFFTAKDAKGPPQDHRLANVFGCWTILIMGVHIELEGADVAYHV